MLRGINVSGQKKIRMADLKAMLDGAGLREVQTYIQSGNFIFCHDAGPEALETLVEKLIFDKYGFDVDCFVLDKTEWKAILDGNPYLKDRNRESGRMYLTFLSDEPSAKDLKELEGFGSEREEFIAAGRVIYLYLPDGYGRTRLNNNVIEKKLKLRATTRNWRTVNKLFEMAGG